jgi:hypothetical protein
MKTTERLLTVGFNQICAGRSAQLQPIGEKW